jgi:dipeptidyl aminopeptidase/acylaminoacyl peptidase
MRLRDRSLVLALVALLGVGQTLQAETAPTQQTAVGKTPRYSLRDFFETVEYQGASFAPDASKVLVSNNSSGIFNAYAVSAADGTPTPMTASSDSVFAVSFFPKDERILYTADQGGNELHHLYVREVDGKVKDLTPGKDLKAIFVDFSSDDSSFFVATNERNPKFFDIYEYRVDGYERTLFFENDGGYLPVGISPDRKTIALNKSNNNADTDVFLFDREKGKPTLITAGQGNVNCQGQGFSPDGKYLYLTTDEGSDFSYLARYELATGKTSVVEQPSWDVVFSRFSKQGKYLAVAINADSKTELRLYAYPEMRRVELPNLKDAEISTLSFSNDERKIAFYSSSSRAPGDLYVLSIGEKEPRKLTRSLNPAIDPNHLVDGRVARFKSFDGVEVPGILYVPQHAPGEKLSALIWVHGGPGGQSRIGYSGLIQALANQGYVLYAINNRGSSGYGKAFFHLDDRAHGKGDLQDCVAAKKMLAEQADVDPNRIGIIGGSYGGYMVLAAMTFAPKEFALGVDLFGVSNWLRTLQSIPAWWEAQKRYLEDEFGSFENEAHLKSISPLFHAKNIVRPLMVLQGANDPRVLQAESDDIVAAARANGAPVEYIVFPDEGHGFLKKENRLKGYQAIIDFLALHLRAPAGAGAR